MHLDPKLLCPQYAIAQESNDEQRMRPGAKDLNLDTHMSSASLLNEPQRYTEYEDIDNLCEYSRGNAYGALLTLRSPEGIRGVQRLKRIAYWRQCVWTNSNNDRLSRFELSAMESTASNSIHFRSPADAVQH